MVGYRWFILMSNGFYEPQEFTYPSIESCENAVDPDYKDGFYGISKVRDDEGIITVIENIVEPKKMFYID